MRLRGIRTTLACFLLPCSLSKLCTRDFVPTGDRVVATITTMMDLDPKVRVKRLVDPIDGATWHRQPLIMSTPRGKIASSQTNNCDVASRASIKIWSLYCSGGCVTTYHLLRSTSECHSIIFNESTPKNSGYCVIRMHGVHAQTHNSLEL